MVPLFPAVTCHMYFSKLTVYFLIGYLKAFPTQDLTCALKTCSCLCCLVSKLSAHYATKYQTLALSPIDWSPEMRIARTPLQGKICRHSSLAGHFSSLFFSRLLRFSGSKCCRCGLSSVGLPPSDAGFQIHATEPKQKWVAKVRTFS